MRGDPSPAVGFEKKVEFEFEMRRYKTLVFVGGKKSFAAKVIVHEFSIYERRIFGCCIF